MKKMFFHWECPDSQRLVFPGILSTDPSPHKETTGLDSEQVFNKCWIARKPGRLKEAGRELSKVWPLKAFRMFCLFSLYKDEISANQSVPLPRNQLLIHVQGLISRAKWVPFSDLRQNRENKASITKKNTFPPKNSRDKWCPHYWGKMTYCMVEMMWWWCYENVSTSLKKK